MTCCGHRQAWQEEESEQHALEVCPTVVITTRTVLGAVRLWLPRGLYRSQLRECLAKQRELQRWKNRQLEARIANETDLARAEERFAARQHEHERVLASRAAEYARHREQWKADRDRERQDHAQEVADLTKLHVSTDSPLCPNSCHHSDDVASG